MYSTRPRSLLKKDVNALSEAPSSEGPNSGYLVLQDEAAQSYWFFGLLKNRNISHFPFPQSKNLTVSYTVGSGDGSTTYYDKVMFIPVLNQPLSSNRYYVIWRKGKHQGRKGWKVAASTPRNYNLEEALGLNQLLRFPIV
ncbi:hypothetical protein Ahy_A01g004598 isoform E [Arachis hypogaea]|uniref:Uncharacterized protein n=1 Tax=Arachis hypogaea TaxID=3818 RepID=A0A445EWK6_ARAHY|nr:hypothetical protein Ahy_A01g004598 isoform E [Arachis hypogaea]